MVGWYHTHPGWGVFLSGMDTFICDHFFNKPLDVALVIDPCQHERGFFQWTTQGDRRTRITKGFYLTASRFRRDELELVRRATGGQICHANRSSTQWTARRLSSDGRTTQRTASALDATGRLGMLTIQLLVVALIAWRVLEPPATPLANAPAGTGSWPSSASCWTASSANCKWRRRGSCSRWRKCAAKNDELTSSNVGLLAQTSRDRGRATKNRHAAASRRRNGVRTWMRKLNESRRNRPKSQQQIDEPEGEDRPI